MARQLYKEGLYPLVIAGAVLLATHASPANVAAGTPLDSIEYSSDVSTALGVAAETVSDDELAADDLAGNVAAFSVGESIPPAADLVGYHINANDEILFCLDVGAELGSLILSPRDVARYDGTDYTLALDSHGVGLPDGARVDAIAEVDGELLLSFDVTVELPSGVIADDEDLVHAGGEGFTLFFDGSAAGVPVTLDLDGAHAIGSGEKLLLSFDVPANINDVAFDDDDVLEHDVALGTWELAYDGSLEHDGWVASDLDALYATPGTTAPSECGDATGDGDVTATDALAVLRAAVGAGNCRDCACDTNGDTSVTATDALVVLRLAVGLPVTPACPPCR